MRGTRQTFFSPRQSRLRRFWYRLGSTINLCWAACVPLWSTSYMPLRGTTEDGTSSPFWRVLSDLPEDEFSVLAFRPRSEILAICWRGSSGTEVAAESSARVQGPTGDVLVDYVGSVDNAVSVLSRIYRAERRLVFADSRARVEELASGLRRAGVRTFVSMVLCLSTSAAKPKLPLRPSPTARS